MLYKRVTYIYISCNYAAESFPIVFLILLILLLALDLPIELEFPAIEATFDTI